MPTTTKRTTIPRKPTSSFVRTLAGIRPTARTSGLSARTRTAGGGARSTAAPPPPPGGPSVDTSDAQRGCCRHQPRDHPSPVDACDLLIGGDVRHDLASIDVDVVALEIE